MSTVVLKPNVQELQADVIKLLGDISNLMGRASKALRTDRSGKQYAKFQQEVADESHKVKHLELRMAIVAPMKAGKSTIINAIVGQDLLPSRNAAMTTLPTEIVFKADAEEAVLVISRETLEVFERVYQSLERKINNQGLEWVRGQLAEYPHLVDRLVPKIQETVGFSTQLKTFGHDKIVETLMDLNDLVRLSSLLESQDLLPQLTDVLRIETPFWQTQASGNSEGLGNLVIVDTPGPNEATSNAHAAGNGFKLARVVKEQLRKSSIVLIVLDFTQLKTEAAEKIKKDVQQVINLRGKDSLYVLINKVDQRLDNDMTPAEVRQFVAAEFGIGDDDNSNRVFEVSARFAFSAANFIQELVHNPDISIPAMKTAESLARQVYGRKWERALKQAIDSNNTEDLKEEADLLWQDSGFDSFLKQAVNALVERAAPKCIKMALTLSQSRLIQLQEDMELRRQGIAKEASELHRQVDELEADLERLNVCHRQLNDVTKIKSALHQQLNRTLAELQEKAQVSLETYWDQKEYQRAGFMVKRGIEVRTFADWFAKQLGVQIEKGKSLIEFKTEFEAEEFSKQAIRVAKQRVRGLLETNREDSQRQIENARRSLIKQLEAETQPIIEKARQRLNETFDVNLSLPNFSLANNSLELHQPRVRSNYRYVDQGYETRKVKKRSFWHWVWIVPYEETERIKRPDKRENYYTVSLEELIDESNRSIEASITTIRKDISKYVDEDFQDRVNLFFEDLDSYLRRYKESLQQAQSDKKLSQDEKAHLVTELGYLSSGAAAYIEKSADYIQYADDLMRYEQ